MSRRKSNSLIFWLGAAIGGYAISRLLRRQHLQSQSCYFRNKVVVITGASRGIGRALALAFAEQGAKLALASRDQGQLLRVGAECGDFDKDLDRLVIGTDVTDEEQLKYLVNTTLNYFGRIDILVNNAGIVQGGKFAEVGPESVRKQIEVNLMAAMRLTQLALPAMLKQGEGVIVNISAMMGRHTIPYFTAYSTSKHGLDGFGEGLRRELAGTGIHILTASPGFADTEMIGERNRALLRLFGVRTLPVEHIARRILEAIVLGQAEVNIGGVEFLAEWIARFSPGLADLMWRELMPSEFPDAAAQQYTE